MYKYFLALGSNLGNKIDNIDFAIKKLKDANCEILKIAPFYKTKPLVPFKRKDCFYDFFYNTAIEIETKNSPFELLKIAQQIEIDIGRPKNHGHWTSRVIDIDILYCAKNNKSIIVDSNELTIPHKELFNRAFVLDPLSQISPNLVIQDKNILTESKKNAEHQAAKMMIVNVNNNSFSEDGILDKNEIDKKIEYLTKNRVAFIDIGAESTNPRSNPISWQEETDRLKQVDIFTIIDKYKTNGVKFSIDTYHPETADFAINNGFDIINDVNGFKDKRMWQIIKKYPNVEAVIMHSLQPNGKKTNVISKDEDVLEILNNWVKDMEKQVLDEKIDKNRIIIDYGIGFGKTAEQDLFIVKNFNKIDNCNFRVLIGHSRKSFLNLICKLNENNRDKVTKQISEILIKNGVDILRLHSFL